MKKTVSLTSASILIAGMFAAITANADLIMHLKLDETSGTTAYDTSGSTTTHNGTLTYMVGTEWADGIVNGALDFNGISNLVGVADTADLNFGSSNFTVAYWIYPQRAYDNSSKDFWGVQKWELGKEEWALTPADYNGGQHPAFRFKAIGISHKAVSPDVITINAWHHIAGVRDGDTIRVYVDGIEKASSNITGVAMTDTTSEVSVGSRFPVGNYSATDAIFDDVRIYNHAISSNDVKQLFLDFPLVQIDFNDADGQKSLANRGTIVTNGTFEGDATYSSTESPNNETGYSGSFDGSGTDGVTFGHLDDLDGIKQLTITAWIRLTGNFSSGQGESIASDWVNPNGFVLYVSGINNADRGKMKTIIDDHTYAGFSDTVVPQDQWTFVALTYDGGLTANNCIYYQGDGSTISADGTNSINKGVINANGIPFQIGNADYADRPFQGLIDNVRIYKLALSVDNLKTVMMMSDAQVKGSIIIIK